MVINLLIFLMIAAPIALLSIYIVVLVIKALNKYLKSPNIRKENGFTKTTLGETIRNCRLDKKLSQEFVAEALGVSRQAVSKWENGTSDPSTSNLIALSRLYEVPAEELIQSIK